MTKAHKLKKDAFLYLSVLLILSIAWFGGEHFGTFSNSKTMQFCFNAFCGVTAFSVFFVFFATDRGRVSAILIMLSLALGVFTLVLGVIEGRPPSLLFGLSCTFSIAMSVFRVRSIFAHTLL